MNELVYLPEGSTLVLDDYYVLPGQAAHHVLTFLVEHLPPQLHLAIATREDPPLPLARLRTRGQLCELRTTDLRCTAAEAADFLTRTMGLPLSPAEIAALEARTEGCGCYNRPKPPGDPERSGSRYDTADPGRHWRAEQL